MRNHWLLLSAASVCLPMTFGIAHAQVEGPPIPACSDFVPDTELAKLHAQHETLAKAKTRSLEGEDDKWAPTTFDARIAFNEETQAALRAWSAANGACNSARDAVLASINRVKRWQALTPHVSKPETLKELIDAEKGPRAELDAALETARKKVVTTFAAYLALNKVADAMIMPDGITVAARVPRKSDPECSIDTAEKRAALKPNTCVSNALGRAVDLSPSAPFSPAALSAVGVPLQREGLATSVSGSKEGTIFSLGLSREFKITNPTTKDNWRASSVTYSMTAKTDGGDLFSLSPDKDGDNIGALNRLSAKSSFTGSILFNFYPTETANAFENRGDLVATAAREACLKDQSGVLSNCEGERLLAWIFADNPIGDGYAHPTHAAAFSGLYFGSPEKYPRFGAGTSVEYARLSSTFIDIATTSPAQIGVLLASKMKPVRHDSWAFSGFLYYRPSQFISKLDVTFVGTITYKDFWEQADKAQFCPAIATSAPFTTVSCKNFETAAPVHKQVIVPGVEARLVWPGFKIGSFLTPQMAFAPKFTIETDHGHRKGLELPLYFAVGSDNTLTAGLKYGVAWDGKKPDGSRADTESALSIVVGKTFSLIPQ